MSSRGIVIATYLPSIAFLYVGPLTRRNPDRGWSREEALINVASAQLNTMGVSPEWFGAIAAVLGISRPALYKYFNNRDDLLFRCYDQSCSNLKQLFERALAGSAEPAEVIDRFLSDTSDPELPEIAVMSEIDSLPPDKQAVLMARRGELVERIAAIVEQGVVTSLFRPVDALIIAETILGMASWAPLYRRWGTGYRLSPGATAMKQILFYGLAADRNLTLKSTRRTRASTSKRDVFDPRALDRERKDLILATASMLLNRRGIGATRVEDVGAAVGLSKRAIYHQIGDKAALIDACVDRAIRFYLTLMATVEASPLSRMQAYSSAVCEIVLASCDPDRSVVVPYVGFGLLSEKSQTAMEVFSGQLTEGYRKILNDGERDGSIRPLPLDDVLASLPGMFSWTANARISSGRSRVRVAEELATLAARGIYA